MWISVFLCSPCNPSGKKTDIELLKEAAKRCEQKKIRFVLDECFLEFEKEPESLFDKINIVHYPHLFLLRAFTKTYAIPGIRLGYGLTSDEKLLENMEKMRQPWNVSVTAQEAGVAALVDCEAYLKRTREYIKKEKFWMTEQMRKLGLNVWGSEANYIFFKGKAGLYEKALKSGLLIRDCSNYEGLTEGHYRIAIRSEEENERLITWLEKL